MKKNLILIIVTVFSTFYCFSQNVDFKEKGEKIRLGMSETASQDIKYKIVNDKERASFIINSEVTTVKHLNIAEITFTQNEIRLKPGNVQSSEALYLKGQSDASQYYKGYKRAGAGTLLVSLLSPLIGLIPAIGCSSTPPKDVNLNYPDALLMEQRDYFDGYMIKSRKIKKSKVWTNWAIGLGINLAGVLILSNNR